MNIEVIEGRWVTASGIIYDMWKDEKHIIDFNDILFIDAVKWCVGVDVGTANPTTFQLMFKSYDGKIYIVDEYYHSGGRLKAEDEDNPDSIVGYEDQKTDLEYANDLKGFLMDNRPFTSLNWNNIDIIVDPAAASFVLQLRKLHFKVKHANNSVLDGIRTVATYMGNNQFFVSDKCTNFINEVHNYSWDQKAQEKGVDSPEKTNDHTMDASRYGLMYLKDKRDVSRAAINVGYW